MKFLFSLVIFFQICSFANTSFAFDLPPPPAVGSLEYKEDFRMLHAYQDQRTEDQCKAADLQSIPSFDVFFGPNTGVLSADEVKQVAEEGAQIIVKVFAVVDHFKREYQRTRPYLVDQTLHPCVSKPGNGYRSYPSGHTAAGIVLASFLAKKFPEKKDTILAQGKKIGINRLIGGVHHPSDVYAARSLAFQILQTWSDL